MNKTATDIDPGPDPNPPILSPKQLALHQIRQLKKDLTALERTVRSIQSVRIPKLTKAAGA